MTTEEAQKVLDELQDVRPEVLTGEAKRLFEAIMTIAYERNLCKSMLKEKDEQIAEEQKAVEQIYADYQDIGKIAFDYQDKIELLEKQIDLMAEEIDKNIGSICPFIDYNYDLNCKNKCKNDYKKCWKQYFENKAKEVE